MTPEINELVKKISKAKIFTVLLVTGALAFFIWDKFEFLSEVSFTLKNNQVTNSDQIEKKSTRGGAPSLEFGEIFLSPSSERLPSILNLEILNSGNAETKNIRINLDFGFAKVIDYEIIGPKKTEIESSEPQKSILHIDLKRLSPRENALVYIHLNTPVFKKISMSSDNVVAIQEITMEDYFHLKTSSIMDSGFRTFLKVLSGGFLLIMAIYLTLALIQKLNIWLKLKWD